MAKLSTIITTVYAITYGVVFFITSIWSFIDTKNHMDDSETKVDHEKELKQSIYDEIDAYWKNTTGEHACNDTINESERVINIKMNNNEDLGNKTKSFKCNIKFIKAWAKSIWQKKKIYWSILPHVADQATDFGVIITYYEQWNNHDGESVAINPFWLFTVSIAIIIIHKVVSTASVYALTGGNIKASILQVMDLLLIRAIWINYRLNLTEPCNPQRYIELLEAVFESAPQILLGMGYILKQSGGKQSIDIIVIISVLFSLWSLTSKVTSDDKILFDDVFHSTEFQALDVRFKKHLCFMQFNYKYLVRVILWRFFEIMSRVLLLMLLWINIGGMALFIILFIEFGICVIFCIIEKTPDLMGNLMFISFATKNGYVRWFYWYRVLSFYLFSIMVTIFAVVDFNASKIPKYEERHNITINNGLGVCMLCLTWITGFISHLVLFKLVITDIIDTNTFKLTEWMNRDSRSSTSRDLIGHVLHDRPAEVKQLLLFGVIVKDNYMFPSDRSTLVHKKGSTLLHYAGWLISDLDCIDMIYNANPSHINTKNELGDTPLHYVLRGHDIIKVKYLIDHNANINEKNKQGMTPISTAAANRRYIDDSLNIVKYLIKNGAETHHKDNCDKSLLDWCKENEETKTKYADIILMLEKQ
eukprot:536000_1